MFNLEKGCYLLLGEGDFSFSTAFLPLINKECSMVSTSFLSEKEVKELHKNAPKNIEDLVEKGVKVYHDVDATRLRQSDVKDSVFQRIIFNFPHIGGKSNIKKNRELLRDFFPSAIQQIGQTGDICVTLAQGQGGTPADAKPRMWHDSWQVVGAAAYCDLVLAEVFPFNIEEYPAYNSVGFRSQDRNFYTKGGLTYKFKRSLPVQKPDECALDVSPVSCALDDRNVLLDRYIASKIDRNLLYLPHHPLSHTACHFQTDFMGQRSGFRFTPDNYIDISQKLPIVVDTTRREQTSYPVTSKDGDNLFLRSCMLDSVIPLLRSNGEIKEDHFYIAKGPIFRRIRVENKDMPIQHEMCVIGQGNGNISMEKMKDAIESTLGWVMMNTNVTFKKCDTLNGFEDYLSAASAIEVTWTSENEYYQNSCNQVEAQGPPQLKKDLPKKIEHKQIIGYLGVVNLKKHDSDEHESKKIKVDVNETDYLCCVLNLDYMAQIRYDIPDLRLFWSEDEAFSGQFKNRNFSELDKFIPLSLYPPLWRHDLSFWENETEKFDEQKLCDIIRNVTGDLLVCVILANVWEEPGTGKISRCYREVYQSFDVAISHARAHAFQNAVRLTVAKELDVELR